MNSRKCLKRPTKLNISRDWTRISRWSDKYKLWKFKEDFFNIYGMDCEGKVFICIYHQRKRKWALLINKKVKGRRDADKKLEKALSFDNLFLMALPHKKEGVSILTTMFNMV